MTFTPDKRHNVKAIRKNQSLDYCLIVSAEKIMFLWRR